MPTREELERQILAEIDRLENPKCNCRLIEEPPPLRRPYALDPVACQVHGLSLREMDAREKEITRLRAMLSQKEG